MSSLQEFLNPVYEVGAFGLELAAYATFSAALLAVIVLTINLLLRRWITAGQMNLLWGLVLVRLMLPIGLPSSFSLQGAVVRLFDRSSETVSESANDAIWETEPIRKESSTVDRDGKVVRVIKDESSENAYLSPTAASNAEPSRIEEAISTVIFQFLLVWPCAAVGIILWTIFVNGRFSWSVNRMPLCRDERLSALWAVCCAQAKIRRTIPVVLLDTMQQPAIMGVLHPRLLLPQNSAQFGDDELRMVMLHELAHVRRRDIAINWALVFVRAVHWWNPIYWLAASRFFATREQACDAFVIRHGNENSGRSYGDLLVKFAERLPCPARWRVLVPTPILGFMLSVLRRRAIAARLRALPRAGIVQPRWHAVTVATVGILLAWVGLTDAKLTVDEPAAIEEEQIFPGTFERADVLASEAPVAEAPTLTLEYEVSKVLRRIAGERYSLDEAKKIMVAVWPLAPHRNHPQCEFNGTKMTVAAREGFHQELQQNLAAWEKSGLEQICVEYRFLTFRQEHFERIKIPWRYFASSMPILKATSKGKDDLVKPTTDSDASIPLLPQSSGETTFRASMEYEESMPLIYSVLTPKQTAYVITGAQGDSRSNIHQGPKVTVFNGTRCSLTDITQRPFVVGVNSIVGDIHTALQPQIAVVDEGTKIFLRPVLSADHKRIQLNGRIEFSDVGAVKTASVFVPVSDKSDEPATIQVPQVQRLRVDITAELENGHSLMLGSVKELRDRGGRSANMFVLLTPTVISDDGDAAK